MKLLDNIQERYRERNKLFLALDVLFTLLTTYLGIWLLFISIPVLVGSSQSVDSLNILINAAFFSLAMTYAVRVIEMFVTGEKRYFALTLVAAIIFFVIAILNLWLVI
ncbi:hypothetical protein GCM10009001_14470 [Virgibacillus siamensis]|uniref:Uncharacterized protein n=1 Tax=Virgibacillus siamensis TaxID=480071 RepID=A0ABN1FX53_9BACI